MKKKLSIFLLLLMLLSTTIAQAANPTQSTTYVVQAGDTLFSIAQSFNSSVEAIAVTNDIVNANLIFVGQELIIPDSTGNTTTLDDNGNPAPTAVPPADTQPATTYVVQQGDTMFSIALRNGSTVQAVSSANNITNPALIFVGQTLIIPGGTTTNTDTTTTPAPTAVPTNPPVATTAPAAATSTPAPAATTATDTTGTEETTSSGESGYPAPEATSTTAPIATIIPPTTTPQSEATTPPSLTGNLLPNASFEGSWYNMNGDPELQIPSEWRFGWEEGGERNNFKPEVRVLPKAFLPEEEHSTFIFDGEQTVKVFKGFGNVNFRLYTETFLQPGKYVATINFFPDLVQEYTGGGKTYTDDPFAGEIRFSAAGGSTAWRPMTAGRLNTATYIFEVATAGTVEIDIQFRTKWALPNNGFFVDDWSLVAQ